jgi:hypothetical protein
MAYFPDFLEALAISRRGLALLFDFGKWDVASGLSLPVSLSSLRPAWSKHRRQRPLPTCNAQSQRGHSSGSCAVGKSVRPKKLIVASEITEAPERDAAASHSEKSDVRSSATPCLSTHTETLREKFQKNSCRAKKVWFLHGWINYDLVGICYRASFLSMSRRLTLLVSAILVTVSHIGIPMRFVMRGVVPVVYE